ncbi:MAG TPA: carboxypeptidase regulatory-like domain-containing protein [Candidatus Sulfotelmatobacter sp.]|nr:carboxypeptidase regulatory-like domain-containing protein [Candidatus Sulfotelmatobacter sp.]
MRNRIIQCGRILVTLWLASLCVHAQQPLKAHIDLTRNGHPLKDASNAVIWLSPLGTMDDPPRQDPSHIPQLVQKNKSFQPALVVIPVGGKVEFPNHDPFFHNVFSLFDGKRFDLGLYESGTTRFVQFDKPGVSFIFCNIHAQMSAVVIALATPYYGVSDARGEVSIADVPAGRYSLQVFHAGVTAADLRALTHEITVAPDDTTLGSISIAESDVTEAHKNKYGRDYDRPEPDSPAYTRQ